MPLNVRCGSAADIEAGKTGGAGLELPSEQARAVGVWLGVLDIQRADRRLISIGAHVIHELPPDPPAATPSGGTSEGTDDYFEIDTPTPQFEELRADQYTADAVRIRLRGFEYMSITHFPKATSRYASVVITF